MQISFLGAAQTVTGSMFLIETQNTKFIVDVGMFQGNNEIESRNQAAFHFNPEEIDFLILTHSHLDHLGLLPRLVKEGFKGKIFTTAATCDLASTMLLDAAKVQEEEVEHKNRRNQRQGLDLIEPLYDLDDVFLALTFFKNNLHYGDKVNFNSEVEFVFRDAGHIVGSTFVEINIKENGSLKKLVFSGDLGNINKPIVRDPSPPVLKDADFVFVEGTYGDRDHKNFEETKAELKEALISTLNNNGNCIIPSFALERAQELLYYLREFHAEGSLPKCKVFLDSPLAILATKIFLQHPECFDDEILGIIKSKKDPFILPYLQFTRSPVQSKKINEINHRAIIIAGSGMCNGGRIKHHLIHNLWNRKNSIIFIGYQAEGTLGKRIIAGEKYVEIFREKISVAANVYTINGFSAHAGKTQLINWLSHFNNYPKTFLIHGEEQTLKIFNEEIKNTLKFPTYIPQYLEKIKL